MTEGMIKKREKENTIVFDPERDLPSLENIAAQRENLGKGIAMMGALDKDLFDSCNAQCDLT